MPTAPKAHRMDERNRPRYPEELNFQVAKFRSSKRWQRIREVAMKRDHFLCRICRQEGRTTPAREVHHIQGIYAHWGKRADMDNLMAVCIPCHRKLDEELRA